MLAVIKNRSIVTVVYFRIVGVVELGVAVAVGVCNRLDQLLAQVWVALERVEELIVLVVAVASCLELDSDCTPEQGGRGEGG